MLLRCYIARKSSKKHMKKDFNITGTCRPNEHYMMDDSRRFAGIFDFVERGKYFVINRPRQYGKTTMLFALLRELRNHEDYLPIKMDFQGMSSEAQEQADLFIELFWRFLIDGVALVDEKFSKELAKYPPLSDYSSLSERITELCKSTPKKIVLLIDEVDASSNFDVFLKFLAILRNKYLIRDLVPTFHSVVLAGVHDIKSLKFKMRNPEDAQFNSPWNIATDFNVVMEFYPNEIAYMLRQYSEAENVKMNDEEIAEKLYYYTSGYPFLVSKLCKTIAEDILPKKEDKTQWTLDDLEMSVQMLLREENNTNFDSLIKNLENNEDLYRMVYALLFEGVVIPFNPDEATVRMGRMYGIFSGNGQLKIHNRIYEQRIYNFMVANRMREMLKKNEYRIGDNYVNHEGGLDFPRILRKFQSFMKEQYSKRNKKLIEREWRLIFLAFLKPIINGKGYDFKEVETSEEKRLDIVVTYLREKHVIELKLWYGEESHARGLNQLANYLDIHGTNKGWLLIFDDRKKPTWREELIHHKGKEIFAVWV